MPETAIDSHAHVHVGRLADDLLGVLERARAASLDAIINVGTNTVENPRVVEMAAREVMLYAAVGYHPHGASEIKAVDWPPLEDLTSRPRVVAVGEFGLDYHYEHSPHLTQRDVFAQGIRLASDRDLPLIVHTRDAEADTLAVLDAADRLPRGVFHCFTGSAQFAKEALDRGFYVSFSGIVTFTKAEGLRDAARCVPLERLLVETDAPYCAPVPLRGKTNEPAYIVHVLRCLAELYSLSENDVRRITRRNASRLFGIGLPEGGPCIVYPIRRSLYVNVTNDCPNRCTFCPRAKSDGQLLVKGHDLHLDEEPSAAEMLTALAAAPPENYEEIVFCGFGEPTLRLDVVLQVARAVKDGWHLPTRLDTNGQGSALAARNIVPELAEAIDAVSVSLNAADAETYDRLCRPTIPNAFAVVCDFIRACKVRIPSVRTTAVAVPGLDIEAVRRLAEDELGVAFSVREYNVVG